MINEINLMLKAIGSNFQTEDGLTLILYIGNRIFLKRKFTTIAETVEFVKRANVSKSI